MTAQEQIEEHYNKASEIAIQEVERLARIVMTQYRCFTEFVMAMGSATFTVSKGGQRLYNVDEFSEPWELVHKWAVKPTPELIELNNLFMDWGDVLKITGTPMRFTAHGELITDW